MTEKKSRSPLLISLLETLLREWGYDTVRQCLAEVRARQIKEDTKQALDKHRPTKTHIRPSAVQMLERLHATVDKKEDLHALAAQFDAKTFLPTTSDVRHFLEMRGQDLGSIKQRQDAFRKVLSVLLGMSEDELMLLRRSGAHTGPTQLAPLSDAIKATSAAARSAESQTEAQAAEESGEPKTEPTGGDSTKP